jgi:hypothetical protein
MAWLKPRDSYNWQELPAFNLIFFLFFIAYHLFCLLNRISCTSEQNYSNAGCTGKWREGFDHLASQPGR